MVTYAQLRKWKKEARQKKIRSHILSKKHNANVKIIDLNPSFTRTNKKKFFRDAGRANTRTKTIFVDERVPKRFQGRIIKHEKLHLKHPRATEDEIQKMTKKKFGWKEFEKVKKSRKFRKAPKK